MPRAIKPKFGYGRTATESPFVFDKNDGTKRTLFIDQLFLKAKKFETNSYTRSEIESLLEEVRIFHAGSYWDEERPKNPQKKVALKYLAKTSKNLMNAALSFNSCLDKLDIETRKYFEIENLEVAEQSADKIYGRACVVMKDLETRLNSLGAPIKNARHDLMLFLINKIEAKFPGKLIKRQRNKAQEANAGYDQDVLNFITAIVLQAFPKTHKGAIRKTFEKCIAEKVKKEKIRITP